MKKMLAVLMIVNLFVGVFAAVGGVFLGFQKEFAVGVICFAGALVFIIYEQYLMKAYLETARGNKISWKQLANKFGKVVLFSMGFFMSLYGLATTVGLFYYGHYIQGVICLVCSVCMFIISQMYRKKLEMKPVFTVDSVPPHIGSLRFWDRAGDCSKCPHKDVCGDPKNTTLTTPGGEPSGPSVLDELIEAPVFVASVDENWEKEKEVVVHDDGYKSPTADAGDLIPNTNKRKWRKQR